MLKVKSKAIIKGIIKMINKKAQGHVEMILSFTMFMGFLLFVFMFMNPFAQSKPEYIMENLERAIFNEISSSIGRMSVIVMNAYPEVGDCTPPNIEAVDYKKVGDNLKMVENNVRKSTIYYGPDFENQAPLFPACDSEQYQKYELGAYIREEMIVKTKIQKLINNYKNDYSGLKKAMAVTNEFVFEVRNFDGNLFEDLKVERKIPSGTSVEALDIPVRIIDENGLIRELILNIRAW